MQKVQQHEIYDYEYAKVRTRKERNAVHNYPRQGKQAMGTVISGICDCVSALYNKKGLSYQHQHQTW